MKIYEALEELIKNKKIVKQTENETLYKYQEFEDIQPLFLEKKGKYAKWQTSSLFLYTEMFSREWEIYEPKEEKNNGE